MAVGKSWSIAVPITKEGGTFGYITVNFLEEYDAIANTSILKVTRMTGSNTIRNGTFRSSGSISVDGNTWYSWGDYDWYFGGMAAFTCEFVPGNHTTYPDGLVIDHNEDGSKTINVSVTVTSYWGSSPTWGGNGGTVSNAVVLTTVPRASGLSAADGTLGEEQKLTVDRKADGYIHTIEYACGSVVGTICTKSSDLNIPWTPPMSLASQNTSGRSVDVTLTIHTYSGDIPIGTKTTTVTFAIPDTVGLTVSDGWATVSPYQGETAAVGLPVYIQGYSAATVMFDEAKISTANAYGAQIDSYRITCSGKQYASPYRTRTLSTAGDVIVTATVIDSRGYAVNEDITIHVEAYAKPILSGAEVFRCDVDGQAKNDGQYLSVTARSNISDLAGLNTSTMRLEIGTLMTVEIPNGETVVVGDGLVLSAYTYHVKLILTDLLQNSTMSLRTIPTAEAFFHGRQGGRGAAFGKYAEADDLLDVDWNIRVQKDMQIDGDAAIDGALTVGGDAAVDGALTAESVDVMHLKIGCKELWEYVYPVDSVYISYSTTSPAELFGGTWERIISRFLWATDTEEMGATAGNYNHTHALNSGYARIAIDYNSSFSNFIIQDYAYGEAHETGATYMPKLSTYYGLASGTNAGNKVTKLGGKTDGGSSMPPYVKVAMWRRIA